jgi:hypothetical protein
MIIKGFLSKVIIKCKYKYRIQLDYGKCSNSKTTTTKNNKKKKTNENKKNKDQEGKGNVHRTQPPTHQIATNQNWDWTFGFLRHVNTQLAILCHLL